MYVRHRIATCLHSSLSFPLLCEIYSATAMESHNHTEARGCRKKKEKKKNHIHVWHLYIPYRSCTVHIMPLSKYAHLDVHLAICLIGLWRCLRRSGILTFYRTTRNVTAATTSTHSHRSQRAQHTLRLNYFPTCQPWCTLYIQTFHSMRCVLWHMDWHTYYMSSA